MAPEDYVRLEMPPEGRRLSVSELLDRAFPAAPEERQEITAYFDLRANPDLPEIYSVFLAVCEEWRDWRCALRITSADGEDVDLTAPVSRIFPANSPMLALRLEQQYRALEYAVRHGFWTSSEELLGWIRSLTALYFLDKHEVTLDSLSRRESRVGASSHSAPALREVLASLQSQGLIVAPPPENLPLPPREGRGEGVLGDASPYAITPLGRRFIAGLLAETESLIDQYDHYKDTVVDPLSLPPRWGGIQGGTHAEFDTGRGADLRVEAFLAEGVDPIRAVFLLRLYDGTFDHRLRDWQDAIEDVEFYEGILEPVVNRDGATPEAMELVIESGLSWLEERQEQARREEMEREILRQAEGETPSP